MSVWDSFQSSTCRISHALVNTGNEILQQCIDIEKKCSFSNQTRAKKYEASVNLELPETFYDKPILTQARMKAKEVKIALMKARSIAYIRKPQHGAYIRLVGECEADLKSSMAWLKKCQLDPHTESFISGAQELALITKYHEKHILGNSDDDRCPMCKKNPETYSTF